MGGDLYLDPFKGRSIGEGAGPDQELAGIDEGVDSDGCALGPGDDSRSQLGLLVLADDEDDLPSELFEDGSQVNGRFRQLIGGALDVDLVGVESLSRRNGLGVLLAVLPQEVVVGAPLVRIHPVGIEVNRVVIDRIDRELRRAGRVGHHQGAGVGGQPLEHLAVGEGEGNLFAELLGEDVLDRRLQGHGIGRSRAGAAVDMQAVAMDVDLLPVKLGFDFDLRGIKDLRVDTVVEVDQHRLPGRAFLLLVVVPVALVLGHLQGGEGAEGEGLLLGCLQRALERGQTLARLDLYGG